MSTARPIIEISNGRKVFGSFTALSDINLSVEDGEILTLLGPSGCGKTTLMRMIAGFDTFTSGSLRIGGADMAGVPPESRPVNMVFQRYALFPHLDVFENVAFGLRVRKLPKQEIEERVRHMLHVVQLDKFANRYIDQISGGQSQRVALARALVNRPKVLLLDEPLAALDLKIRQHMLAEMKRIHRETGATFVYVTHDQDEAMILSDRVVLLEKGRIVQLDRPEKMYARPNSLFAAKFLGETNLFEARVTGIDGRSVSARTASGIEFRAESEAGFTTGSEVFVSVRPEALRFRANGPDAAIAGTVRDIVFTGSRSFVSMETQDGTHVRAQVQSNMDAVVPGIGERAAVSWNPSDVVILPRA